MRARHYGSMRIRLARVEDFPSLQEIERRGGELFRGIGMPEIAEDQPFTFDELAEYQAGARAWVAVNDADDPVGYLVADVVDGNLHVEQVTIDPAAAGRGVGAALVEHVAGFAGQAGFSALTLTTFRDVPWNGPYYRRLGFREMSAIGPELDAVRKREAEHGLDRWPRICMIRPVPAAHGADG